MVSLVRGLESLVIITEQNKAGLKHTIFSSYIKNISVKLLLQNEI